MASGKLTPLGDPALNAPKWFAAMEVISLAAGNGLRAGEARRQVAAAEEELDDGDGGGVERTVGRAVAFLMGREKVRPAVMDELPERRGAGAAGLMDGRHKECAYEHLW